MLFIVGFKSPCGDANFYCSGFISTGSIGHFDVQLLDTKDDYLRCLFAIMFRVGFINAFRLF